MSIDTHKTKPVAALAGANGDTSKTRKTRTKKPVTAKSAGMKISALLDELPDHEAREKALNIAKTLSAL